MGERGNGQDFGQFAPRKEIYTNGSNRIVWAWAGIATGIVVLMLGSMAKIQWETNSRLVESNTQMAIRLGQLETKIANLERTVAELRE